MKRNTVRNTDLQLQLRIKFVLQKDFDTVLFYVCMYTDFSFVYTNFLFTENSLGKTRAINLQIAEIRVESLRDRKIERLVRYNIIQRF